MFRRIVDFTLFVLFDRGKAGASQLEGPPGNFCSFVKNELDHVARHRADLARIYHARAIHSARADERPGQSSRETRTLHGYKGPTSPCRAGVCLGVSGEC